MATQLLELSSIQKDVSKFQFRSAEFNAERVEWLVANWNDNLVDPLDVWVWGEEGQPETYYLLSGHHRLEAGNRLGKEALLCRLHRTSLSEARILALLSNTSRLEYTPLEKSKCVQFLVDEQNLSYARAAEKMPGMSDTLARKYYCFKFLENTDWELHLDALNIHALEVGTFCVKCPLTKAELNSLLKVVVMRGLSVADLCELLREIKAAKEKPALIDSNQQPSLFDIEAFADDTVIKTLEKRSAMTNIGSATWWLYELINRSENQVPEELKVSLSKSLRQLYAFCISSDEEEVVPVKNVRKKAEALKAFKDNQKPLPKTKKGRKK